MVFAGFFYFNVTNEYFLSVSQKLVICFINHTKIGSKVMKILDLFDAYFLMMMLIQGTVVLTVDARSFKKAHMDSTSKKAVIFGRVAISTSIILFILRWMFK